MPPLAEGAKGQHISAIDISAADMSNADPPQESLMARSSSARPTGPTPVELQILLCLVENARHGYGIKQEITQRTDGEMQLGSGTLYEAIQRLETSGCVEETAVPPAEQSGRRKRHYRLTSQGRRVLESELGRLDRLVRFARDRRLLPET
jgi:DNA-binding PadR family transcriptional regulator